MVEWIARVEMIRTTADGGGGWCGVVTGMGATPELALDELRSQGEELARQVVQEEAEAFEAAKAAEAAEAAEREAEEKAAYEAESARVQREEHHVRAPWRASAQGREWEQRRARKSRDEGPRSFRFEVVDVRLTPAPEEGGSSDWLAYGTLARLGEQQN